MAAFIPMGIGEREHAYYGDANLERSQKVAAPIRELQRVVENETSERDGVVEVRLSRRAWDRLGGDVLSGLQICGVRVVSEP